MCKSIVTECEMIEDLQHSLINSPDVTAKNEELEKEIKAMPIGTLVSVQKQLGSMTTILSVQEVTETFVANNL